MRGACRGWIEGWSIGIEWGGIPSLVDGSSRCGLEKLLLLYLRIIYVGMFIH